MLANPYARVLTRDALGPLGGLVLLAGLAVGLRRSAWHSAVLLASGLVLFVDVGSFRLVMPRQILPAFPAVCVLAGLPLACAVDALRRHLTGLPLLPRAALGLLALVPATTIATQRAGELSAASLPDTREMLVRWFDENVPEGARVALEVQTPGVHALRARCEVHTGRGAVFPELRSRAAHADFVVVSAQVREGGAERAPHLPDEARLFHELFARSAPLATFRAQPGRSRGPTFWVFGPLPDDLLDATSHASARAGNESVPPEPASASSQQGRPGSPAPPRRGTGSAPSIAARQPPPEASREGGGRRDSLDCGSMSDVSGDRSGAEPPVPGASLSDPARPAGSTAEPAKAAASWPQRVAASTRGMVATQHARATEAGVEVLEDGGNAIDAAVAAAFALGVCEPAASGLGGQTMLLVRLGETRRTVALDGSSRAPNRATPGSLSSKERLRGHRATTVPSTPAALAYAARTWGRLPLARLLEPAIRLAEEGFAVTELLHGLMRRERRHLERWTAGALFLHGGKRTYRAGETLVQPALAATLRRLARRGVEDFYTGEIARAVCADMESHAGLLHRDDLAQIPWPIERKPLSCPFGAQRVLTFPPPGAGRTLIEMLNVLQHFPERHWSPDTPRGALVLAEVIRQAFLDRRDRPFDPDFYPQVDDGRMVSPEYAHRVARRITRHIRTAGETTHLSVMDAAGNAVALTQSIERVFGSCAASPELGFLYNNYMSAFEYEDVAHPYHLRPNAVPWASVAPTIVFRGPRPWVVLGSPGSERIASSIVQVLVRLLRQPPFDAVSAPRLHCSMEGKVSLEASRLRSDIPAALERHGYTIDAREPYAFYLGCVQLVLREGKELVGVADPRRDGSAGGPA